MKAEEHKQESERCLNDITLKKKKKKKTYEAINVIYIMSERGLAESQQFTCSCRVCVCRCCDDSRANSLARFFLLWHYCSLANKLVFVCVSVVKVSSKFITDMRSSFHLCTAGQTLYVGGCES